MSIECFVVEKTERWMWRMDDGTEGGPITKEEAPEGWQTLIPIYRRADNGEEFLGQLPPGAIIDYMADPEMASAFANRAVDGSYLVCVLPDGHHWSIDGRATNCALPDDDVHRCWVRHGTPPKLTVDKAGNTCAAGAGSIQTPEWHGFLRDGMLVE